MYLAQAGNVEDISMLGHADVMLMLKLQAKSDRRITFSTRPGNAAMKWAAVMAFGNKSDPQGKATLVLYLEDPNALKKSHEADFERLSGVWHLLGKEVASVPEEYEPLQAPNDGFT